MGILSGLFRTRDGPKNATSGSTYSFFMGTSAAGKSVNERSAMQMTAVYACVRILSESIAGLPLHMYQYASIFYNKSETWIESESLYEVLYTFEMEGENNAKEQSEV